MILNKNSTSTTSSTSNQSLSKQLSVPPKGIIFDMDGTLIQLNVVEELKQGINELAADNDKDTLGNDLDAMIAKLTPEGKRQAKKMIEDLLQGNADNMTIQEGGPELVAFLAQNGVKRAVLTRNLEKNAFIMQQKYAEEMNEATFDPIVGKDTRFDDSDQPVKGILGSPKAEKIRQICKIWGCDPSEVIMVGDSISDDIVEGNRAGCGRTVLLQPKGYELNNFYGTKVGNSTERKPTLYVESLPELKQYLEESMSLQKVFD